MHAPLPLHEEDRLQALARYQVVGTGSEPAFDRLTSLAARLFQVPIAGISLLGETKQWMKSCYGFTFREVKREHSFAAHAILLPPEAGVFLVPDLTLDPRFADNPLVTKPPHCRFYAGAPLRTADGQVLGCLGIIDKVPRDFSAADQAVLLDLAAAASDALELRYANLRLEEEAAERLRAEEAVRRSEKTLRQIAANTPGMVYQYIWHSAGVFSFPFVGEGCREFFGVEPEALYERPTLLWEVLQPEDIVAMREIIATSARDLTPCHFELPYRAPDGSRRWMQGMSRPERLPDGGTLWNGMLLDVTDRRRAQQSLEDSHLLLSAVTNGTTDAVFIRDTESRYLLINPAGAAYLGASPGEILGQTDERFFSPEAAAKNRRHDLGVIASGQTVTYEDTDVFNGVQHTFLSTKAPFRDASGNLIGVIGIARDISEQRRNAETLREAKEEAERANNAKSEFLSRMSHELRTPLNAILGFGQLLEMQDSGGGAAESVDHILKAGRHLLNLIDEVLALSHIEAGRLRLSLEPVSVREVVEECLGLTAQMAREREIRCEADGLLDEDHLGVYVLADRQRLRQVLLNLLSNAIKYNRPGGSVRLSFEPAAGVGEAANAQPRLRLSVADTGVGLSPEETALLFRPFERLKAERTRTEGTGLGLALSKGLVEAMGGTVGVRSRLGEGSTFWVELPAAENPCAAAGRHGYDGFGMDKPCRGTVLYIEDNLSNARLLEMLLEQYPGVELLGAEQGSLGLEMARSRQPDLILLDLHLPDMPGWEVLAALQEDPRTRDIPAVIISADATPNRIERLRRAGARDYLTKPIHIPTLLELLREHLHHHEKAGLI